MAAGKSIFEYRAVVWDLDGTLYYQRKMRLIMLKEMIKHALCHPLRIKELFAVKKFREIREKWDTLPDRETTGDADGADLAKAQYRYVAGLLHMESSAVREAVEAWMYERPLAFIASCRDEEAARLMESLRERGIANYIFSDYPIEDKLKALSLSAEGYYAATDARIGVLKPDPKSLFLIMSEHGLKAEDLFVIGDRDSRDGEAARRAGCAFLILAKSRRERERQYRNI